MDRLIALMYINDKDDNKFRMIDDKFERVADLSNKRKIKKEINSIINAGIPLTKKFKAKIAREYFNLSDRALKKASNMETAETYEGTNDGIKKLLGEYVYTTEEMEEEGLVYSEEELVYVEESEEEESEEELFQAEGLSPLLDQLKAENDTYESIEDYDIILRSLYREMNRLGDEKRKVAERGEDTSKFISTLSQLNGITTKFESIRENLVQDYAAPAAEVEPENQVPGEPENQIPGEPGEPGEPEEPEERGDPNPRPGAVQPGVVDESRDEGVIIPVSKFKPNYHLVPIQLMYGSVTVPDWDKQIENSWEGLKLSKNDINDMIESVIDEYNDKLFLKKRMSDGDIVELNECVQLMYSFERGMRAGGRQREALVSLKDLTTISNLVPLSITPQEGVQAALDRTQNASKSKRVVFERERPTLVEEPIFVPENRFSRFMTDEEDLIEY